MVSLKDIAKECQVSVATVSKALNDHADISEERKKMIREKAEEMGYRPNLFARTLKTNRSYNIGVLFTDAEHNGLTHDYFAAVLDSFKVAAEARDYDLTFVNCGGSGGKRMTYLEHARYRGFDGIMIALISVVVLDYLTGVVKAIYTKKLSSEIGFKGIAKKIFIFLIVAFYLFLRKFFPACLPYVANDRITHVPKKN